MKHEFHFHIHVDKDILNLVRDLIEKGIKVAESPEMTAFRAQVTESLANISADITRLLERNPSLSEEDKQALVDVAANIKSVADIVPE